jgi:hypothetical protein
MATAFMALASAHAQAAGLEQFEGPVATWQLVERDCALRIEAHERTLRDAHRGQGSEYLRIAAGNGTRVYMGHVIGPARAIAELSLSVWIKSDRAGLQLMARAVLPRSRDPRTGEPVTALLRGTSYGRVGSWEELNVADALRLLEGEVRVLRSQIGSEIDPREAYVDLLILNVYGGAGVTNVWIDDLEVRGFVATDASRSPVDLDTSPYPRAEPPAAAATPSTRRGHVGTVELDPGTGRQNALGARLVGSLLLVDGQQFFPRAVEYRGEPLELIASLGFNTILLDEPPTHLQLEEAERHGMWIIAGPPDVEGGGYLGPAYDRVLAWNLGRRLPAEAIDRTRHRADAVRLADRRAGRPLLCAPLADWRGFSRHADLVLADRPLVGSSNELFEFGDWLRQVSRFARPGTPLWATIETQPAEEAARQFTALGRPEAGGSAEPEQLRLAALSAAAAGVRGVVFTSRSRLDAGDAATQLRAAAAELVNIELESIAPWLAAGQLLSAVETSDPHVRVAVVATDRSRLLMVLHMPPQAQFSAGAPEGDAVSFVVPGVPDSSNAYMVTPVGIVPLRHRRVTGGLRITLENYAPAALVVLTHDPLVVNTLARGVARNGPRAAALEREIAARAIEQAEAVQRDLGGMAFGVPASVGWLVQGRSLVQRCDQVLQTNDYTAAQRLARQAAGMAALTRRAHWEHAARGFRSPVASPLCTNFAALPGHWQLAERLRSSPPGANQLAGGEMESLESLVNSGWSQVRRPAGGVIGSVELSPDGPHGGRFALRMRVVPEKAGETPPPLEEPPLGVVSAAVALQAGQLARISGWVRLSANVPGGAPALVIRDSLGGEPLALRVDEAGGWREFVMYRASNAPTELRATFALEGIGEAWVDDVSVTVLDMPWLAAPEARHDQARRLPQILAPP